MRAPLWTSIASKMGSAPGALAALAGIATAADAASAAAVERKPRRVVLIALVIEILDLPKVEGSMVGAGRMLTHPSGSFWFQGGLLHFLQAEAVYFRARRRNVR